MSDRYEEHRLLFNRSKSVFKAFSEKLKLFDNWKHKLSIDKLEITNVTVVIYLGVKFDLSLSFRGDMKHIKRKMAVGIKTQNSISGLFNDHNDDFLTPSCQASNTLLTPFTSQLEKRRLLYFGETIKLGFKDKSSGRKLTFQFLRINF